MGEDLHVQTEPVRKVVFPPHNSVLFIDFLKERRGKFYIKGGRMLWTKFSDDWEDACKAIVEGRWQVIFLPGFVPKEREKTALARLIAEKKDDEKPILVVHHGLDVWSVLEQYKILKRAGVRMASVPWNYDDPSVHRSMSMENIIASGKKETVDYE